MPPSNTDALDTFFASYAEPEKGYNVELRLAPHATQEDFDGLNSAVDRNDVVVFESVNWTNRDLLMMQSISSGIGNIDSLSDPILRVKARSLFGKRKSVAFYDPPENSRERYLAMLQNQEGKDSSLNSVRSFFSGDINQAILDNRKAMRATFEMARIRDDYFVDNFEQIIQIAIEKSIELQRKQLLKVLVTIGAGHRRLVDKISAKYRTTITKESKIDEMPSHVEGSIIIGNSGEISDEMVLRGIVEQSLRVYFRDFSPDSNRITKAAKKLAKELDYEKLCQLSKELSEYGDTGFAELAERIVKFFFYNGYPVPQNKQGLEERF